MFQVSVETANISMPYFLSKTGISDDKEVGSKRAEVVIQALNSVVSTRKCFFKL